MLTAERHHTYYLENHEKILEQRRKYRLENREKIAECNHKYNLEHQERHRLYRAAHREEIAARRRILRRSCRLGGEFRDRSATKTHHKDRYTTKVQVLTHYCGGKIACAKCGETDIDVLCIDHIHDDGEKCRKIDNEHGWEWYIYKHFPEDRQVLCFCCNQEKAKNRAERVRLARVFPTPRSKYVSAYGAERHRRNRALVDSYYGGGVCACVRCGRTDGLTLDHVNDDGAKHPKDIKHLVRSWDPTGTHPAGFQTLCANCNWRKELSRMRNHASENKCPQGT